MKDLGSSSIMDMDVNDPTVTRHSASVGDYLKAIWEVGGSGAASTKDVADRLSVASASVTNMFARLQEMGLAKYERYQGASLTEVGDRKSTRLNSSHANISYAVFCL